MSPALRFEAEGATRTRPRAAHRRSGYRYLLHQFFDRGWLLDAGFLGFRPQHLFRSVDVSGNDIGAAGGSLLTAGLATLDAGKQSRCVSHSGSGLISTVCDRDPPDNQSCLKVSRAARHEVPAANVYVAARPAASSDTVPPGLAQGAAQVTAKLGFRTQCRNRV